MSSYRSQMEASALFAVVKSKWPQQIDISDGKAMCPDGFLSWRMVRMEEEISGQFESCTGLVYAATWPFHQALGEVARTSFLAGQKAISRDDVDFNLFVAFLVEVLRDPSWSEEREEFSTANPSMRTALDL